MVQENWVGKVMLCLWQTGTKAGSLKAPATVSSSPLRLPGVPLCWNPWLITTVAFAHAGRPGQSLQLLFCSLWLLCSSNVTTCFVQSELVFSHRPVWQAERALGLSPGHTTLQFLCYLLRLSGGDTVLLARDADGLNSPGECFLLFEEVRRFLKASIPWLFAPDTTIFSVRALTHYFLWRLLL